jgi:hypothetical protein
MDEASPSDVESPMHKNDQSIDGGVKKERASFGRLISLGKCSAYVPMVMGAFS